MFRGYPSDHRNGSINRNARCAKHRATRSPRYHKPPGPAETQWTDAQLVAFMRELTDYSVCPSHRYRRPCQDIWDDL